MKLELREIRISNFKGVREMTIDFSGPRTQITGANGTGKTTIADAFSWVLFNKDSAGNAPGSKDFREKPLDDDGREIHNLETSVELFCTLDGQRFDLKRTQAENWVKKRSSSEATFQGNVSTYWINGVEVKLQDFKARIAAIASEDVFRLVGVLSTFNAMDWKKRRQQLLNLVDEDVDSELLARDEYRPLADAVAQQNVSVDDYRKVAADQRKRINDELRSLPIRIDEAKKSLPTFGPREVHDAEYIVADSRKDIEKIDQMIAEVKAGSDDTAKRTELVHAESDLIMLKRRAMDDLMAGKRELQAQLNSEIDDARKVSARLSDARLDLDRAEKKHQRAAENRDELLAKYAELKSAKTDVSTTCPTCGQPLPEDMVAKAAEKAEADRREAMAGVKADGAVARKTMDEAAQEIEEHKAHIAELESKSETSMQRRKALEEKLRTYPSEPDYEAVTGYAELVEKITSLRSDAGRSPDERLHGLEERKRDLQGIIDRNSVIIAKRDAGIETEKRIEVYEKRQGELAQQLDDTDRMIALVEKFVQDRCGALEASINAKFPTVRWKLFDQQINGGIADTCECMIPCASGLVDYGAANTAAQINADVEIVNVLSRHYDVEVPLFVDNAERVNDLSPTDSQLITLAVSTDPVLTTKGA